MTELIKALSGPKGTVNYRAGLLAVLGYIAWQVTDLRVRVAVLEQRFSRPAAVGQGGSSATAPTTGTLPDGSFVYEKPL